MATTGKVALNDSQFASIVQSELVHEVRPANTSRDFVRFATKGPSSVARFVSYQDPGPSGVPGTTPADDLTDITSTALGDDPYSATAAEGGFRVDVSDLVREIAVQNVVADTAALIGRGLMESWETALATALSGFSNVTTAASTLTPLDLLSSVSALEQRDMPGPYVAYVHPKGTGELRAEIATTTAVYAIGRDGEKVSPFGNEGFFGTYMGIPIWQTSAVLSSAGLRQSAVFVARRALGCYELWGNRIESQRFASTRTLVLVGTNCFGFVKVGEISGQFSGQQLRHVA